MNQIKNKVNSLKDYFRSGKTASISFRIDALDRLKKPLQLMKMPSLRHWKKI